MKCSASVKAYWWSERPNFGDALAPLLLERFAGVKAEWTRPADARIVCVGSILDRLPFRWDGYILGSGKMHERSCLNDLAKTANILSLRGPLTARGLRATFALGDPGILARELVGEVKQQWDVGILPWWLDDTLAAKFSALIPKQLAVTVIHAEDDPLAVLCQVGACRHIVTSSLHGIIAADAFGIPRQVEYCPKMDWEGGGDFKFRDYSASIETPFEPGKMVEAPPSRVEQLQRSVRDAFQALGAALMQ
jgi:pyruvyltransferase